MQNDTDQTYGVSIHTGFPNPGADARLRGLDINQLLIQNSASTFLMSISGGDWQHLGIFSDDVVVIDRSLYPQTNDLVVWHCGGDFEISELNRMRKDATMWGVATAVIHQFRKSEGGKS